jgi:glycosyltransferase involved in cell wall biosynthesis
MRSDKVSLYIPCYNVAQYLTECLDAVFRQTYPIDEVLVIDDASTDETAAIARRYPVRIITHPQNRGLAAVRNTAFHKARNEFVASVDADCAPQSEWLGKCLERFDEESIAGVSGKRVDRYTCGFGNAWRTAHMSFDLGPKQLINPPFIGAGHTVYRRSVVEKAGMFNEQFRRAYEDVDLSQRIMKLGYIVVYEPSAVIEHLRVDTVKSSLETMWRYQYHALASPDTLAGILYNFLAHTSQAIRFTMLDIRHCRFQLVPIDAIYTVYSSYLDLAKKYPK